MYKYFKIIILIIELGCAIIMKKIRVRGKAAWCECSKEKIVVLEGNFHMINV